ncbi:MAG TPA: hypothetical protein VM120_07405, partial [Bryobacteraceae bacterium]|nr:hypothetical protein [Bryobacteraceae bacterium]
MKACVLFMFVLASFGQQRPAYVGILDRVFPHVVDGGSWKSSITLVNLGTTEALDLTIQFFTSSGQP